MAGDLLDHVGDAVTVAVGSGLTTKVAGRFAEG
jgi:hypothetical protein